MHISQGREKTPFLHVARTDEHLSLKLLHKETAAVTNAPD